jgi:hypothetical protein
MDAEQRLLCLAARTSLDAEAERRLDELIEAGPDWDRLKLQAQLHEVTPLVGASLARSAQAGLVPESWTAWATLRSHATVVRNLAFADALVSLVSCYEETGLEPVPVKGLTVAERYYGGLALRPAADIDVLVRGEDLPRARELAVGLGWVRRALPTFVAEHHPFHDVQYHLSTPAGPVCLEIHTGLWNPEHFQPLPDLLDRTVEGTVNGHPMRMLSDEDTLLHLAIHRSRSPLRLRFLGDVAEVVRQREASLDWELLVARARLARARTAVYSALSLARELLGAPTPESTLAALGVPGAKRRLLRRTCGPSAMFREAPPDDRTRQPSLSLRLIEQDGAAHVGWAFARTMARKVPKRAYERRRARLLASAR